MAQGNGRSLRVGVVGCGAIGRTHLNSYRNNGIAPVALADAIPASAEAAAKEYGGRPYGDYREMLAEADLDALSVCTPPTSHREVSVVALEAGVAVLCEKPMTASVEDAEALEGAVERTGTLFMPGHCHRFQPHVERLRRLIDEGELGVPRMFRFRVGFSFPGVEDRWFSDPEVAGGGILLDTHVHTVDAFRYLIGEVEQVTGLTSTMDTPLGPALRVEDSAIVAVRSPEGVLGVMEASWRTAPGEVQLTVYGTGGRATVDYQTSELRVRGVGDSQSRLVEVEEGNRFDREIAHFLACVRGDRSPRLTVRDGALAIRILAAAYSSQGVSIPA